MYQKDTTEHLQGQPDNEIVAPNNVSNNENKQNSTYIGDLESSAIGGTGTMTYTYNDYDPTTTEAASYTHDLDSGVFTYTQGAGVYTITAGNVKMFDGTTSAIGVPLYIFSSYDPAMDSGTGGFGIKTAGEMQMFSTLVTNGFTNINVYLENNISLVIYTN